MGTFYNIVALVKPDAKPTKSGEPRKTNFLEFIGWLDDKGNQVRKEAREFSSLVSSMVDLGVESPEDVRNLPSKAISALTSKITGLSAHLAEEEIAPADFWANVYVDLASDESETDPAFRFYRLVLGQIPMEDLPNADMNDVLNSHIKKMEDSITKMKDSALQFDPDGFVAYLEDRKAKNGVTSETLKVKGQEDRVVTYVNLKAPKAK